MLHWDPNPNAFVIPLVHWPVTWYGLLFALGFAAGISVFRRILIAFASLRKKEHNTLILKEQDSIVDQMVLYVLVGTVVGARLGHFLFYERPATYLGDPLQLMRVWEGGLSSHGAAVGICCALWFLSRQTKKIDPGLTWLRLLDFACIPALLAGALIRVGNFINQEILGTPTNVPWAVIFGHPSGGEAAVGRHPVQLYEAFCYLVLFCILWRLSKYPRILLARGRLLGLFLVLVFGCRFLVEFFKEEQSQILSWATSALTMGQILSIPVIAVGLFLILRRGRDL